MRYYFDQRDLFIQNILNSYKFKNHTLIFSILLPLRRIDLLNPTLLSENAIIMNHAINACFFMSILSGLPHAFCY